MVHASGPRSYDVQCEDGHVVRRNRQLLLVTKESFQPHAVDDVAEPRRPNKEAGLPAPEFATPEICSEQEAGLPAPVAETPVRRPYREAGLSAPGSASPVRRRSEGIRKAPIRLDL